MPEVEKAKESDLLVSVMALKTLVENKFDTIKLSVEGEHAKVSERLKTTEDHLAEVDKKLAKARFGNDGCDALMGVLPERFKRNVEAFRRHGTKIRVPIKDATGNVVRWSEHAVDPLQRAALEAWFKNAAYVQCGKLAAQHGKDQGKLMEEMEKIVQALGDEGLYKAANSPFAIGVGATGGFLVPSPVEAMVLRVIEDTGVLRLLSRIFPMSVDKHLIPDDATGVTVAEVAEAATIPESEPTFGQKTLQARMIAARGKSSIQSIQDAVIGLLEYWLTRASEAYALFEDDAGLESDSGSTVGLRTAAGVNAVTNGANGAAVSYAKITEQVYAALKRSTRTKGAAWVMAPQILRRIIGLTDTNGNPILNRQDVARVLSENIVGPGLGEGTILGYPVFSSDVISVLRTVGTSTDTSNIYFGPFGQGGIIIGDLTGIAFDVSDQVYFETAQIGMRLLKRTGILVGVQAAMTVQTGVRNI